MARDSADISVIIASYNRLWALPQAIDSCRSTNCRTEIIVVDDGSTDGTWSWLQTQQDVISIRTDNWGKCWAANAGFAVAGGEFIRFLDSDDWILPGANDRQLEIARAMSADVVVAGYVSLDAVTGAKIEVPWVGGSDFIVHQIAADSFYSAYLMRRSFISKIPHRQEFSHDDSMFVIELAIANPKVAVDDSFGVVYRSHAMDHLSRRRGFDGAVAAWRSVVMYKKTLTLLQQRDECTEPRKHAVLAALWLEARKLAQWDMKEASELTVWIRQQDEKFTPPVRTIVSGLYRLVDFAMTERIVWLRRMLLEVFSGRKHLL